MKNTKNPTKKKPKLHVMVFDHAKVDPSHCLTDGLFRPLKKASYKGLSLDITYLYKDYVFRWVNYCPLSIVDQSVFLAIHRLASEKGRVEVVDSHHEKPVMREVRNALQLKLEAEDSKCLVLETTFYEIAKLLGYSDTGPNLRLIKDSVLRLSSVSFMAYRGNDEKSAFWQANLFGGVAGVDGKLLISINPTLSRAIAGESAYTFVSMSEQRCLKSDVAKRLHVWLSSWIGYGDTRAIGLDILMPHVWGDTVSGGALRTRRNTLRKALLELQSLDGWICYEDTDTKKLTIKRQKLESVLEVA